MSNKIVLHALNFSRATRILWLLEILQVEHELKLYKRDANYRAPPELEKLHPLGKSPVIEIIKPNGKSVIKAETGNIIDYLVKTYDTKKVLTPKTEEGDELVSYYLHYTEGSLQGPMVGALVLSMAKKKSPYLASFLVGAITSKINNMFFKAETLKNLKYLESIAKENDGGYFVENKLTAADIILSFPIAEVIFSSTEDRGLFESDPKTLYPYLYKWAQLILNDKQFQECRATVNGA